MQPGRSRTRSREPGPGPGTTALHTEIGHELKCRVPRQSATSSSSMNPPAPTPPFDNAHTQTRARSAVCGSGSNGGAGADRILARSVRPSRAFCGGVTESAESTTAREYTDVIPPTHNILSHQHRDALCNVQARLAELGAARIRRRRDALPRLRRRRRRERSHARFGEGEMCCAVGSCVDYITHSHGLLASGFVFVCVCALCANFHGGERRSGMFGSLTLTRARRGKQRHVRNVCTEHARELYVSL